MGIFPPECPKRRSHALPEWSLSATSCTCPGPRTVAPTDPMRIPKQHPPDCPAPKRFSGSVHSFFITFEEKSEDGWNLEGREGRERWGE